MKGEMQAKKAILLLRRAEKYFYKYLLTHDKAYIDKFFSTVKKAKRILAELENILSNA